MTSAYHENAALIGPVRAAWFRDGIVHLVVSTTAWALCGTISRSGTIADEIAIARYWSPPCANYCDRCMALRFGSGELEG